MKILLVTRGSQGDVLPYLAVARELVKRGHEVTVNIPHVFEEMAKKYPVKVVLQDFDNIGGMMPTQPRINRVLKGLSSGRARR